MADNYFEINFQVAIALGCGEISNVSAVKHCLSRSLEFLIKAYALI